MASTRQSNALSTLTLFVHAISKKGFGGWEYMEILAGGVSESDVVFSVLGVLYLKLNLWLLILSVLLTRNSCRPLKLCWKMMRWRVSLLVVDASFDVI